MRALYERERFSRSSVGMRTFACFSVCFLISSRVWVDWTVSCGQSLGLECFLVFQNRFELVD